MDMAKVVHMMKEKGTKSCSFHRVAVGPEWAERCLIWLGRTP